MSDAAIRSTLPPPEPDPALDVLPASSPRRAPDGPFKKAAKALASLRLTVVLFVLSLFLVFFGTMAQVDEGVWTVVSGYFRASIAWIPFQVFVRFGQTFLWFPKTFHMGGAFPYPGGYILGTLLMVNLVAAHLTRFKLSWNRSGILVLHSGLIVMLLGELVTGLTAVESKMVLTNGETSNYVDVNTKVELAFSDPSDPNEDAGVAVPGSLLAQASPNASRPWYSFAKPDPDARFIRDPQLPVDIEVVDFMKNSDLLEYRGSGDGEDVRVSQAGVPWKFVNRSEGTGVDTNQREDAPAARVILRDKKTGAELGKFLVTVWYYRNFTQRLPAYQFAPQQVVVDGKPYTVELRLKRIYKPYTIELKQFHHDMYPGTDKPKNFSSDIRLQDATHGEDREVKIYMNNPLRYGGETFYQSGFIPGDRGTVLQVVDNPGAWLPYLSCLLVTLGMVMHFTLHLFGFVSRRAMA